MVKKSVAIFCQPRTCSSYFIDAICNKHNLINYFEFWKGPVRQVLNVVSQNSLNIYKQNCIKETKRLFANKDYAIKFFPTTFYNQNILKNNGYKLINEFIITDITTHWSIPNYTDFFILERDITDIILSYLHGYKNKWHYESGKDAIDHLPDEGQLIKSLEISQYIIDYQIVSHILNKKIETYLQNKNLPYVKLNFDEVPNYIKNNFPIQNYRFVESNFNYKELLSSYENIQHQILQRYGIFENLMKDITFT